MTIMFCLIAVTTEAANKPYELITEYYTVQDQDTLDSIARTFIKKNTYGKRKLKEFEQGILELNPELLSRDPRQGDVLMINYWIKGDDCHGKKNS